MVANNVLITGADGYVGRKLAKAYLQYSDLDIIFWIRSKDKHELSEKVEKIQSGFPSYADRITIATGDLRDSTPFKDVVTNNIKCIIHTAAITRFNVESDLADAVNREGTRKVLDFAHRCSNLQHYAQVSTVYTSGLSAGKVNEEPVDPQGPFANHYERSKCEAEHILLTEYSHLPWHIYRIATIISDNDDGHVVQYNVIHNTIRLLFHGLISILPGVKETPIYLVTGQFIANAIYHLCAQQTGHRRIFNICHEKDDCIKLGGFIDSMFENFSLNEEFQKRRILKPLFTEYEAFDSLAGALDGLGGIVVRQALQSMRPFVKQMYITKDIDNQNFRSEFPGYASPNMESLLGNVVQNLIETKWGREPKCIAQA